VAVMVVAVMVIVCGRHGLWPSWSNPVPRCGTGDTKCPVAETSPGRLARGTTCSWLL